jgi:hypothetical protein
VGRNIIHGSDAVESAQHEINLWFKYVVRFLSVKFHFSSLLYLSKKSTGQVHRIYSACRQQFKSKKNERQKWDKIKNPNKKNEEKKINT